MFLWSWLVSVSNSLLPLLAAITDIPHIMPHSFRHQLKECGITCGISVVLLTVLRTLKVLKVQYVQLDG